jgi:RND family efflux transporter MFP subunit
VSAARAGAAELTAVRDYSVIRAPFSGIVTRRFVDPGAFAAPGAPLLHIQDTRRLRIVVTATPEAVRELARGDSVNVRIEGVSAWAIVEGAVPAAASIYTVNAIVDNARGQFLPGSAASIALPLGMRAATLIPTAAVRREGDLTGILIQNENSRELRWVRLGAEQGGNVEVVAGVRAGERVFVPTAAGAR